MRLAGQITNSRAWEAHNANRAIDNGRGVATLRQPGKLATHTTPMPPHALKLAPLAGAQHRRPWKYCRLIAEICSDRKVQESGCYDVGAQFTDVRELLFPDHCTCQLGFQASLQGQNCHNSSCEARNATHQ